MKLKLIKSKIGIIIIALFSAFELPSQCVEYQDRIFTIGYGIPLMARNGFLLDFLQDSYFANNYKRNITGPVNMKYEKFISSNFSIGMNAGLQHIKGEYSRLIFMDTTLELQKVKFNFYQFHLLFRFNSHFAINEKANLYWGLGIGFKTKNPYFIQGPLETEASVGVRYRLSKKSFFYSEIGFGKSNVQAGLSFKL